MSKILSEGQIIDITSDRSDSSKIVLKQTIASISQSEVLAVSNVVQNPHASNLYESNSNNQIVEKNSTISQNKPAKATRHNGYTKFRKSNDGRLAGAKKIKKTQNIVEKYAYNKSTNKYFLDLYSKTRNSLGQVDKKKFDESVKIWFQIENNKLDAEDTFPTYKLIKQAPLVPTNQRYIEPMQSVRIFDWHFVLDSTCLQTDERSLLPKQVPYSYIKNVKHVDKMIIDKKHGFYCVHLNEMNTIQGKKEYCQNEIEFLKKWLLNLSNKKAKDFADLLSDMTSPQNFEKLTGILEMSKTSRIDVKKLNADTVKYIKNKPNLYMKFEVSRFGNNLSMPSCTEFGMNKKMCEVTMHTYNDVRTSDIFKIWDTFVMIDQFETYSEFFKMIKQNKDTFIETGVQDPDMIVNRRTTYAVNSDGKKLHGKLKIFIEKYAQNGTYYEKVYNVIYDLSSAMPLNM